MTEYYKYGVNLSAGQKAKISSYYKKGKNVSIRLSKKDLDENDFLALTKIQLNQLTKSKNSKKEVQLSLFYLKFNIWKKLVNFYLSY